MTERCPVCHAYIVVCRRYGCAEELPSMEQALYDALYVNYTKFTWVHFTKQGTFPGGRGWSNPAHRIW